jgi:hypothetical protein
MLNLLLMQSAPKSPTEVVSLQGGRRLLMENLQEDYRLDETRDDRDPRDITRAICVSFAV